MTKCKYCDDFITWFKDWRSKWIPLDFSSDGRHEGRKYVYPCKKGCGAWIYFDHKQKSASGKLIPMEVATHKNHACSCSTYSYTQIRRHILYGIG